MIKKALFLSLLGVLCVGTALAGTTRDVTFELTGKAPAAGFSADLPGTNNGTVHFDLTPTQLPDGSAGYYADIYWYDGSNGHEIDGLLPASTVTFTALSQPLQVNITKQDFYVELESPFGDDGAFISLEGTFTPYTGIGSETGSFGNDFFRETHLDGSVETNKFTGTNKDESATFEGTFVTATTQTSTGATYSLSVQAPYPNAQMGVQVGTMSDIITTP